MIGALPRMKRMMRPKQRGELSHHVYPFLAYRGTTRYCLDFHSIVASSNLEFEDKFIISVIKQATNIYLKKRKNLQNDM